MRATSSTLVNADAGVRIGRGLKVQVTVLNVLNARASDIKYLYVSRLRGEAADGVEGVHFHPVEPRQVRASLGWAF